MRACASCSARGAHDAFSGARLSVTVFHEASKGGLGVNGEPLPERMFTKISNERPLEFAQPVAPTPPAARRGAGAVRRA